MPIKLNLGAWSSVFAVPSCIVDESLKLASAYQLKVLLYILRHSGEELTYDSIGESLSIHSSDVKDAFLFWKQSGVLSGDGDEVSPAQPQAEPAFKAEQPSNNEVSAEAKKTRPLTRQPRPDSRYVAERILQDQTLCAMLDEVQILLSKPLSSGDTATLYMLYDTYGLPAEVLLMLIGYCVSVGKTNMSYIEKTAISWSDDGIRTLEQADEKITELKARLSAWGKVASVFGLKNAGTPTKAQLNYAAQWVNEWNFSDAMLREAYERCVDYKGSYDLKYINAILKNWNENAIFTLNDIAEADSKFAPAKVKKDGKKSGGTTSGSASYDIERLENSSIFDD